MIISSKSRMEMYLKLARFLSRQSLICTSSFCRLENFLSTRYLCLKLDTSGW